MDFRQQLEQAYGLHPEGGNVFTEHELGRIRATGNTVKHGAVFVTWCFMCGRLRIGKTGTAVDKEFRHTVDAVAFANDLLNGL